MSRVKRLPTIMGKGLLVSIAALALALLFATSAFASLGTYQDAAGVLNRSQVASAASGLPYKVNVYTTNTFSGSSSAFDQRTVSHIDTPSSIVIAIDTVGHHVTVVYGTNVSRSNSAGTAAKNAFISSYQSNSDYTAATVSALNSLQGSLGTTSNGNGYTGTRTAQSSGLGLAGWCLIGLAVIAVLAFVMFLVRRSRGGFGGFTNRPVYNTPPPVFDPTYNQGGYPQNYGPGYPQQRPGMNPWAAGGLGAAAGGLLGYELGKESGEREAREEGGYGNGGNFGGGSSGDFGGGNNGDFGGGSSGDFGGGGGDFGGGSGGDFGGGGGGGDFGGGSSGSF